MPAIFPAAVATQAQLWTQVNGVSTTLDGGIDNAVTTITVIDTTNFPATGYIVIDAEVISYTSKTGTTFLGCTRAADGSSAASHATAATVAAYAVAAHHNDSTQEIVAIQTLLGNNSQNVDLSGRAGFGVKLKSAGGNSFILTVDDDGNLTINPA